MVEGIVLVLIAGTLLIYVVCWMRKKSRYLIMIPVFTLLWGITGIVACILDQANAIYDNSTAVEKLTI